MVTINYRIKCDYCGKFVPWNKVKYNFIPDTHFTVNVIEHLCFMCFN